MATGMPLKVWFVNVGHGDCTIVKFPSGRVMMVDICNSKLLDDNTQGELMETAGWLDDGARSLYLKYGMGSMPEAVRAQFRAYEELLDDPIDVMKSQLPGEDIWRFVLTHPDMDHMTGLYRLMQHEGGIDVVNFWDTDNTKGKAQKTGKGYDERDWTEYQRVRESAADPKVIRVYREAEGEYYTNDDITILSPTSELKSECNEAEDWNNLSQAMRIEYGESSLILAGDVETRAQELMVEHFGGDLSSTILKAPHHGRDSGYHSDFVKKVNPDYTIVSVGKKPDSDASNKYRHHTNKKVLSTRFQGTIYAELFNDGDVRLYNSPKKGLERIDDDAARLNSLVEFLMRQRTGSAH
ncbi:MAG: hypothetical protein RLN60_05710 [Phycisphaerales bacterium]